MKTVVINASPKRKGVNAQLMKSAAKGAESVGADVEYVDLYKLDFCGCMSCLICKKESMENCKCYWRDELSPLIDRILASDCLLIGAPIFFSEPTSHYRALIERLIFCIVSYDVGNVFNGKVNVGLLYNVNFSRQYFEESVRPNLKQSEDILKMLNGKLEVYTFENIAQRVYDDGSNDISSKENQFNLDLDKTFEIGARLSKS